MIDRWELLVIAGMLIIAAGVGLIYPPAGIIVFGAGLVALGISGAVAEARARPATRGGASGGDKP